MIKHSLASVVGTVLTLSAGVLTVGCSHEPPPKPSPSMTGDATGDQMVSQGDSMIEMGQRMKDHAAAMKNGDTMDGMSRDELATKGQKMMNDGAQLKQKGLDARAAGR